MSSEDRIEGKESLEKQYETPDPWGFQTNPEDAKRKEKILSILTKRYKRAIDIGCGEGWITKDLPADEIFGYELSDTASSRLPENVKRAKRFTGKYDLVIATGVIYPFYNGDKLLEKIKEISSGDVLLCNITDWEIPNDYPIVEEFKYREYVERIRFGSQHRKHKPS